jgi:hypothetical protein
MPSNCQIPETYKEPKSLLFFTKGCVSCYNFIKKLKELTNWEREAWNFLAMTTINIEKDQ